MFGSLSKFIRGRFTTANVFQAASTFRRAGQKVCTYVHTHVCIRDALHAKQRFLFDCIEILHGRRALISGVAVLMTPKFQKRSSPTNSRGARRLGQSMLKMARQLTKWSVSALFFTQTEFLAPVIWLLPEKAQNTKWRRRKHYTLFAGSKREI